MEYEKPSSPLNDPSPTPFVSNKPNKLVAAKLHKVLNASIADDTRIKSALSALSDIPDLDETELRRNLRGTIEKKEIATNQKFMDAFSVVVKQLEHLETEMKDMQASCTQMRGKLDDVAVETAKMIKETSNYQDQSEACDTRIMVADRFLEKFTLNQDEIHCLTSSTTPVDNTFFEALTHLQQIHSDCKLLLMTAHQRAGLQIMESMSLYQESAYDKLYRWTQFESRSSFGGDSIDVSTLMTKALYSLRHRPVLFQTILDELAMARRDAVARAFMTALTRGGPGGTPRPIELQAHDSLRYVGDMLAWVHQACAGEKEMLEGLFHRNSANTEDDYQGVSVAMINDAVDDLLDAAMEGTCRPLKTRMEQVLVLQPNAITSYKMANLIQFYAITMGRLLRKNSVLAKTLYENTEMAYKYFFKTLNAQSQRLLQNVEPPSKDLTVAPVVRDMTAQLKEILASYDSSLVMATQPVNDLPEFDFGEILDAIVEPLLQMCEASVEKLNKVDNHIYMINCIHYIQSTMTMYSFTEKKRQALSEQTDERLDLLANEQCRDLLQQSGLSKIDQALKTKEKEVPLSSLPNMNAQSLKNTLSKLDSFLVMASADVSPQLQHLATSEHCQKVQDKAIHLLLDTYRRISEAVQDPANGYGVDPHLILPRTVEDMEAIFSFAL
ncbi:oligomeric Golgi complex subunit 6 [Halteromyces radiatus]|uniref:oligomeric Golgi complex subunit 6 n=1 Tax=Halteromyces radiatus TaxID=101107 RepID=UPI00221F4D9E|nr:oligomeric Golgi complex subunit 6 [Halteromyces radiatus]KAI8092737.1 oligomeric Golgi complex subunit 6 [Halteromyces radiatus]